MKLSDWIELTKLRLVFLALMMAAMGYVLGLEGSFQITHFLASLLGILLLGLSCGVLNQYMERDLDARMARTKNRPLPAGRLQPEIALKIGIAGALIGELTLLIGVNSVTAVLGALTLLFYLGIYTPSKRISSLSTLLGAIPGAMPPLMGFTASHGTLAWGGAALFGILFLWQVPHFLAIAWLYREDYAKAGFPVLTVVDEVGANTVRQVLLYSLVLLLVSLVPTALGLAGATYFYGALFSGTVFVGFGALLAIYRSRPYARRLFLASLLYLPVLFVLLVWDRT
jgi:heme o synthase